MLTLIDRDWKTSSKKCDREGLNRYLTAVLNSTQEAIFILNCRGDIKHYNEYARLIIRQFTAKDISLIPNLIEVVPRFRKESLAEILKKAGARKPVEYEVLYPGGRWLEVSFFPISLGKDEEVEICGTIRDITRRKESEQKVMKSEARYHSLFESMMEGVIFQSLDKFESSANASACQILEQPAEVLRINGLLSPELKWVDRKFHPVQLTAIFSEDLKIIDPIRGQVLGLQTENGIKWLLINAEPVKTPGFDEMAGVFSFIDFSKIVEYQEEHALLSQVMKEISNIVVITDEKERIQWVNNSFTRSSGYKLDEVRDKRPGELFKGKLKDPVESEKIRNSIKSGLPVEGEILNYDKRGKPFWTNYSIHPVKDEEGRVVKFFSIQSDITHQKNIQEQIHRQHIDYQKKLAAAQLRAGEEKQTQIGQELHDNINQVLAVSLLYSGMIANGQGNASRNIGLVIENLKLAISEIRALSHQLVAPRFKTRSLDEIFQELSKCIHQSTALQLIIHIADETLIPDEIKLTLYRIAQEQLNNVNKHANASNVWVSLGLNANEVFLKIKDDGNGFDMEDKQLGIGLGNISDRLEACSGKMKIQTEPGKGCLLDIRIPL